jgi:hypothetical protein
MGMEEYYDYVFPEEAGAAPNLKLLEAAMRWKRQKLMTGPRGEGTAGSKREGAEQQQEQQEDDVSGQGQQDDDQQEEQHRHQPDEEDEQPY